MEKGYEKQYQVTLFCPEGKYKPVSTIVKLQQLIDVDLSKNAEERKNIHIKGLKMICEKRGWDNRDLSRLGYSKVKVRMYDKVKIDRENEERYEKIKEEKYKTGEWKRPKHAETK
jgi:hypothetical protein